MFLAGPHQPLGCRKPTCLNKNYMFVCMDVCMFLDINLRN